MLSGTASEPSTMILLHQLRSYGSQRKEALNGTHPVCPFADSRATGGGGELLNAIHATAFVGTNGSSVPLTVAGLLYYVTSSCRSSIAL